jgi:Heterokaryon incompatibility protein (HET)
MKKIFQKIYYRREYGYHSLPAGSAALRLLTIIPNKRHSAAIECTVSVALLDESPHYEALSYTWGDPSDWRLILLDGQWIKVTYALHSALKYIRREDKTRIIWADAVCINQKDDEEKTSQVQQMSRVYSQAQDVIVWLGKDVSKVTAALDFMRKCQTELQNADQETITRLLEDDSHPCWDAVSDFFGRPWFSRVWVCQEYALAPSRQFQCGAVLVPADAVLDFSRRLLQWWPWIMEWLIGDDHMVISPQDTHPVRRCVGILYKSAVPLINLSALPTRTPDLLQVLTGYVTGKHASDTRDRIFGLLALVGGLDADPNKELIKPDYTLSARAVFIRTMAYLILCYNHLDALNELRPPLIKDLKLPSWVCDWSPTYSSLISANYGMGPGSNTQLYDTGGSKQHSLSQFDLDAGTVKLEGFTVDVVSEVFSTQDEDFVADAVSRWKASLEETLDDTYPRGCGTVKEAFWRTIFADRCVHTARDTSHFDLVYAARDVRIGDEIPNISPMPPTSDEEEDALLSYTANSPVVEDWRLFRTEKGLLGLAKEIYKPGYHVVVFIGGQTPYLLLQDGTGYKFRCEW